MKLHSLLLICMSIPVLFSCAREAGLDAADQSGAPGARTEIILSATGETPEAKATLEFPSVLWEDSDEIAIFDGYAKNIFTIPSGSNSGKSASFRGEVHSGATEFYAASPASAGLGCACVQITV